MINWRTLSEYSRWANEAMESWNVSTIKSFRSGLSNLINKEASPIQLSWLATLLTAERFFLYQ